MNLSYISGADLAKKLSLSERTIIDYARRGVIPCIRIGRHYRFDEAEVKWWLETNLEVSETSIPQLWRLLHAHRQRLAKKGAEPQLVDAADRILNSL